MTLAKLIIRPERCLRKVRVSALVNRKAPRKLVFSTVSQSDWLILIRRPSLVTPALLTRISTRPACSSRISAAEAIAAASETSTAKAHALRPKARISAAVFSEFSAVRETTTTSAPA